MCLTHRSHSDSCTCASHYCSAPNAGYGCSNRQATAGSHPGRAAGAGSRSGHLRGVVRRTGPYSRSYLEWGAAGGDSPSTSSTRLANGFLSSAANGFQGGLDQAAGRDQRIPGRTEGFFAGKGSMGLELRCAFDHRSVSNFASLKQRKNYELPSTQTVVRSGRTRRRGIFRDARRYSHHCGQHRAADRIERRPYVLPSRQLNPITNSVLTASVRYQGRAELPIISANNRGRYTTVACNTWRASILDRGLLMGSLRNASRAPKYKRAIPRIKAPTI